MPPPPAFTFALESGVQVTCDVGYLCANFSLGLSVLDLGTMYATDVRRASSLDASYPRGGGIITRIVGTACLGYSTKTSS